MTRRDEVTGDGLPDGAGSDGSEVHESSRSAWDARPHPFLMTIDIKINDDDPPQ